MASEAQLCLQTSFGNWLGILTPWCQCLPTHLTLHKRALFWTSSGRADDHNVPPLFRARDDMYHEDQHHHSSRAWEDGSLEDFTAFVGLKQPFQQRNRRSKDFFYVEFMVAAICSRRRLRHHRSCAQGDTPARQHDVIKTDSLISL